jgi:hypothetical protein
LVLGEVEETIYVVDEDEEEEDVRVSSCLLITFQSPSEPHADPIL